MYHTVQVVLGGVRPAARSVYLVAQVVCNINKYQLEFGGGVGGVVAVGGALSLVFTLMALYTVAYSTRQDERPRGRVALTSVRRRRGRVGSLFGGIGGTRGGSRVCPLTRRVGDGVLGLVCRVCSYRRLRVSPLRCSLPGVRGVGPMVSESFGFIYCS